MKLRISVVALICALPGVAACSPDGGFAGEARALPGVRDARVHKEALDTDYYGYTAIIDMEAGASRDEIVGALDLLRSWKQGEGNGGDDSVRLYLGGGTTELDDVGWGDGAHHEGPTAVIATAQGHARNVANAELLLRATRELDAPVTVRDHEWAVTTDDPRTMMTEVLAVPDLASVPGFHPVQATEGAGPGTRRPDFSTTEPLTPAHLAAYDRAVTNAKLVREGTARIDFVGSQTGSWPSSTDGHPGAIWVAMRLQLADGGGPRALASDPLRDPRWPAVAAQLDLLSDLPEGSQLTVDLEWGRSPEGGARHFRWLVDIVTGSKVHRAPLWNDAAAAHLAR